MPPNNIQYQNLREGRSWPFADNSSLLADTGEQLEVDAVSDAFLLVRGTPYLAEMGPENVVVKDIQTDEVLATGPATGSTTGVTAGTAIPLADPAVPTRSAGVIVLREIPSRRFMFTSESAPFAVGTFTVVPNTGVEAIKVGNQLLTGDIRFIGEAGIEVTSDTDTLFLGASGYFPESDDDYCADLSPIIRKLSVVVEAGSLLSAHSPTDGLLVIGPAGFTQDEICPPDVAALQDSVPDDVSLCEPYAGQGIEYRFSVFPDNGRIRIEAAPAVDGSFPVRVQTGTIHNAPPLSQVFKASSVREAMRNTEQTLTAKTSEIGYVKVGFRGGKL